MTTRFPKLHFLLTGEPVRAPSLPQLRQALAEQIKRGGRGSDIAAAELRGIRAAEMEIGR